GRSVADEFGQEGIEIIEIGLRDGEKMYEELLISGNESSTSNDKIFKSKERFIEHDELLNVISNIKEAISSNDHERIINILSDYVEGFSYE
ncbi:MAG: polysaccharide biosynthesis protein, partial [Gammaproteobacteria bacterium]